MAMLLDMLSPTPVPANFLPPRNVPKTFMEDFESGGVAIGNTSAGLTAKTWRAYSSGTDVWLEAPGVTPFILYTGTAISELQVTFDKAMQPFLAFVDGGVAKYRWYNINISGFQVDTLPVGATSPRCSLDDKRFLQLTVASIVLAYMQGGSLYMRKQEDDYAVDYLLASGYPGFKLVTMGMNEVRRLQFQLV